MQKEWFLYRGDYMKQINALLRGFAVILALAGGLLPVSSAHAGHYKNSDLLAFSQDQRDAFYSGAFMSIGHVVSLRDEKQADCIWKWYFDQPATRIMQIEAAMKQYPDHSPTAIFLGMLQKDCGKIGKDG
jgi:hypothetical protein